MRSIVIRSSIVLIVLLLVLAAASGYTVRERRAAILTRFGEPVAVQSEPGLYFKLPYPLEDSAEVDLRARTSENRISESLTAGGTSVILETFVVWQVDPQRILDFYVRNGPGEGAEENLDKLVRSARNSVIGGMKFDEILDACATKETESSLSGKIEKEVRRLAGEDYAIEILMVGVSRVALPEENVRAVFDQMRAERGELIATYIGEGRRQAQEIRSQADLERQRILADATLEAGRIQAQTESEQARIYSEAHGKDPEFYTYLRELRTIEAIVGEHTTMIFRDTSPPFSVLNAVKDTDDTSGD
ncbi:MAG: protease modulator HflC [Planctomycetes bacterium]|nr:protease modulator HflC [Planctomycetota bacterium]